MPNPDGSLTPQEQADTAARALEDAAATAARNMQLANEARAAEAARQNGNS